MAAAEKLRDTGAKAFRARWADEVRQDRAVKGAALAVALCLIFDFANHETLECFPFADTVAAKIGVDKRTVQRSTARLQALGYLEKTVRGRRRGNGCFFRLPNTGQEPRTGDTVVALSSRRTARTGDTSVVEKGERVTPVSKRDDTNVGSMAPEPNDPKGVSQEATHTHRSNTSDFDKLLKRFKGISPRVGDLEATEAGLLQATGAGADPEHILAGARAYAAEQKGNGRQYIAFSENWLAKKRWAQFAPPATPLRRIRTRPPRWKRGISTRSESAPKRWTNTRPCRWRGNSSQKDERPAQSAAL